MISVNRSINDPFYRYKMPPVEIAVETNKTLLKNLELICKSFHRDPQHVLKYLSLNFGCNTKIVTAGTTKFYLTGVFDSEKIQNGIYDFIDNFVLCKKCENPETRFIEQNGVLKRSCNSCGSIFNQELHKMNSYFIRDVNDDKYVDKNYEKSQISYENYQENEKQEGSKINVTDLFNEFISHRELQKYKAILREEKLENVLFYVEEMLESNSKEENIKKYLKELIKIGHTIDEIEEYFSKPKKSKKRNLLIKKHAKMFIRDYEE
ncbi:hypothetical protein NUSPORA_01185 [Nucleospora cyclopteri]